MSGAPASKSYSIDTITGDVTWQPATGLSQGQTSAQAFLASGNYYQCTPAGALNTSASPTNGQLRCSPFYVPSAVALTRIGMEVTSAGDAASTIRLGIYADNGQGYPGALVLDAGTIAADSATVQEITISQALAAGLYWVGAAVQGVTTTPPTQRTLLTYIRPEISMGTATPIANQGTNVCWIMSGVTGALPAAFATSKSPSGTVARIFVKVA